MVDSAAQGFNASVVTPVEGFVADAGNWLADKWDTILAHKQAQFDLLSAADHGDKRAQEQVALQIAAGFAGSTSMRIASGHAFQKHVLGVRAQANDSLFRGLGIRTVAQLEAHVAQVMANPTAVKTLSHGRTAYWDAKTSTVVIQNPKAGDMGTAFQPSNGASLF